MNYTGESDEFKVDKNAKIEMDTSFISDLQRPNKYIENQDIPVDNNTNTDTPATPQYEPITITKYYDSSFTVESLGGKYWIITIGSLSSYYDMGYNKIKISYSYYAKGTRSLLDGYVQVHTYITNQKSKSNAIYYKAHGTSKNAECKTGEVVSDLGLFAGSQKIYLLLDNQNWTEEFTISNMKMTITIYHE